MARETLWASDSTANRLEELQFSLNEGACIQASTTGVPVLVPDLGESVDAARWPIFAAAVLEQTPARALFALPLQWGVTNLGVLDLYRGARGGLDRAQWLDALSAVDLGALWLLDLRTEPDPDTNPDGDTDSSDPALGNRAEVHQATGMVSAQLGVGATETLARMRAHAFAHQRLLIDVARDVVNRRVRFTEDTDNGGNSG